MAAEAMMCSHPMRAGRGRMWGLGLCQKRSSGGAPSIQVMVREVPSSVAVTAKARTSPSSIARRTPDQETCCSRNRRSGLTSTRATSPPRPVAAFGPRNRSRERIR